MSAIGLMLMLVGGAAAIGGGVLVATSRGEPEPAETPDPTRLPEFAETKVPSISMPAAKAPAPTTAESRTPDAAARTESAPPPALAATSPVLPPTLAAEIAPVKAETVLQSSTAASPAANATDEAGFDDDPPLPTIGEPPEIAPVVIPPPLTPSSGAETAELTASESVVAAPEAAPPPEPAPVAVASDSAPLVEPAPVAAPTAARAPTPGLAPRERLVETLGALGVPADQAGGMFEQAEGLTQEYTELPPDAALAARCLNIIEFEDPGIFAHEGARAEIERFLKGVLGPSARVIWPQPGDDSSEHEVVSGGAGPVTELALPGFEYVDPAGASQRLRALVRTG
jgi:hypothetical protein